MKICFGLLCCGLSLGAFAQQKTASVQKLRQDTAALGRRVVALRQQADNAQFEFMRYSSRATEIQNRRDTLHDIEPAVYKHHWDSLTTELIKNGAIAVGAQNTFDSLLVRLDSTLGLYNTAVQRLQAAERGRK